MPVGVEVREIQLHTCEKDTFGSREGTDVDGIVVHTTDCAGFPRATSVKTPKEISFLKRICDRAVDLPGLKKEQASYVCDLASADGSISDSLRLCVQAAGLPRTASWNYCVGSQAMESTGTVDIVEFIPPDLQAHHCGSLGGSVNKRSVGIENCYPGALSKRLTEAEATAIYEDWGWPAPSLLVGPDGVRRWYSPMEGMAFGALVALCTSLVRRYPKMYWIAPHNLFAPNRRIDPDPPVDLDRLRSLVSQVTGRQLATSPRRQ